MWALGFIGNASALSSLLVGLTDDVATVRAEAALATARLRAASATGALERLGADLDHNVRARADEAIGLLRDAHVLGLLK